MMKTTLLKPGTFLHLILTVSNSQCAIRNEKPMSYVYVSGSKMKTKVAHLVQLVGII